MIKIALCMVLVGSTLLAPVAAARDDSIDESPEDVVRAAYGLLSYDPTVPTDRESFGEYFSDDAVVSFGPSPEEVAVLRVDEFLDEIQQRVQAGEFGGVGHTFNLEELQCWVVGDVAKCMVEYRFERPGEEDLVSTESVLLGRSDGRWLIHSISWLVRSLDEAEPVPMIDASLLVVPTAARGVRPTPERTWDRALPILGKKVVAKGFSLPKPYGVALVAGGKRQDVDLSDLAIGIPGGGKTEIPFLDFSGAAAETAVYQAKFDLWLFPFLNVFAVAGRVDGESEIPFRFLGSDLMDLIGTGDRCEGLLPPPSCFKTYSLLYRSDIGGDNIGIGLNPALGFRQFFFTMPTTWTWTELESSDRTVESFYVSPRVGLSVPTESAGALSVYIGAAYLEAENFIVGSITLDTDDMEGAEDGLTIEYEVLSDNSDRWNYLVGFNWALSGSWQIHAEVDAGGTRQGATVSATWRF